MKIIFSHPTANANVRAAVDGLLEAGDLHNFYTSLALFPNSYLDYLGKFFSLTLMNRRSFNPRLQPYTLTWPWIEVSRHIASKVGLNYLVTHEDGIFSVDSLYTNMDRYVAKNIRKSHSKNVGAVYAYEDGAAYSFHEAKKNKMQCLYDLPIGYWRTARRLLQDEQEKWPEWSSTMTGLKDSENKLARKDEELQLADQIFVASQFTANTLKDFPGNIAPIKVIPYGFPPVYTGRVYTTIKKPLKLLFVGGLSQRKGVANLFQAVNSFENHVELTIVGQKSSENCVPLNKALSKHRWIPSIPHAGVLQLMREHDVLVFPSLFEGFGLVITEAMSQGTPVITTNRTAGPDLITHGSNGWLVEAGSTQALIEAIERVLYQPELIANVGLAAQETANQRPWTMYGQELSKAIMKTVVTK